MKRMSATVESLAAHKSGARRKLRVPSFGLFCCSLLLAITAEYCAYLNDGGDWDARRILHVIALTVFFTVHGQITILFWTHLYSECSIK